MLEKVVQAFDDSLELNTLMNNIGNILLASRSSLVSPLSLSLMSWAEFDQSKLNLFYYFIPPKTGS